MDHLETLDIAAVARLSGLPASTLRYYEEKGLIRSVGRQGLRRLFNGNILQTLALITLGQRAGFSLEEIGAMLTPEGPGIDRDLLREKADELDRRIRELTAMRNGLRHAAACPQENHLDCPKFLRILKVSSKMTRRPAAGAIGREIRF